MIAFLGCHCHASDVLQTTVATITTAITAFTATNIDDIFMLMLLFARLEQGFTAIHVVIGQYLGILALVLASLVGLIGRAALPEAWIGLLGLLPIGLGLAGLAECFERHGEADTAESNVPVVAERPLPGLGLAGIMGVAALTIANGSDNIGVYMPMFTSASSIDLQVTVITFLLLTGCWCLLAWWLVATPALADVLQRYAGLVFPAVLVAIGGAILHRHHTLASPLLLALTLLSLLVMVGSLIRQLNRLLASRQLNGGSI